MRIKNLIQKQYIMLHNRGLFSCQITTCTRKVCTRILTFCTKIIFMQETRHKYKINRQQGNESTWPRTPFGFSVQSPVGAGSSLSFLCFLTVVGPGPALPRVDMHLLRTVSFSSSFGKLSPPESSFTSRSMGTVGTDSTQSRCRGDSHGARLVRCSRRSEGGVGGTEQVPVRSTGPPAAALRCKGCKCGGRGPQACRPGPHSCSARRRSPGGPGGAAGGHSGRDRLLRVHEVSRSRDRGWWPHRGPGTQSSFVLIHCCQRWRGETETFHTREPWRGKRWLVFCKCRYNVSVCGVTSQVTCRNSEPEQVVLRCRRLSCPHPQESRSSPPAGSLHPTESNTLPLQHPHLSLWSALLHLGHNRGTATRRRLRRHKCTDELKIRERTTGEPQESIKKVPGEPSSLESWLRLSDILAFFSMHGWFLFDLLRRRIGVSIFRSVWISTHALTAHQTDLFFLVPSSLKPLANGLWSIFSLVICRKRNWVRPLDTGAHQFVVVESTRPWCSGRRWQQWRTSPGRWRSGKHSSGHWTGHLLGPHGSAGGSDAWSARWSAEVGTSKPGQQNTLCERFVLHAAYSRARADPACCWWAWAWGKRRSASSSGPPGPESPGGGRSCRGVEAPLCLPPPTSLYSTAGRRETDSQWIRRIESWFTDATSAQLPTMNWKSDCWADTTHRDTGG